KLIDAGNPTLDDYASPPDVLQRGIPPEPQYLIARDIDGQAGAVDIYQHGFEYDPEGDPPILVTKDIGADEYPNEFDHQWPWWRNFTPYGVHPIPEPDP